MEIGDISNPNNGLQSINAAYSSVSSSSESIASGDKAYLDAAAMAIIEMSYSRIAVSQQGTRNANDAISMLQTFEAAGSEISNNLTRMSKLASQATTGTYADEQKALMQQEFDELGADVNRIASNTLFNGNSLISSQDNPLSISIGTGQSIEIESSDLGIDISGMDLVSDAQGALVSMQDLIERASSYRGYLGSQISRLEKAVEVTEVETENALAIASKISNTDIALETAAYSSNLIVAQMSIAIQIQANVTQERTGHLLIVKEEPQG